MMTEEAYDDNDLKWPNYFQIRNCREEQFNHLWETSGVKPMDAEREQICYLRLILVIFEACSGLKVNWRKSDIFLVKEEQQIQSGKYFEVQDRGVAHNLFGNAIGC
ncbi:hypothetical protein AABB24_013138 [Solanum stoloniferum]|uniref:Uncharacterized protein n=2 Tax=Solanum TaxID=4107 RepID=A0ABD2U739_9SOLN